MKCPKCGRKTLMVPNKKGGKSSVCAVCDVKCNNNKYNNNGDSIEEYLDENIKSRIKIISFDGIKIDMENVIYIIKRDEKNNDGQIRYGIQMKQEDGTIFLILYEDFEKRNKEFNIGLNSMIGLKNMPSDRLKDSSERINNLNNIEPIDSSKKIIKSGWD